MMKTSKQLNSVSLTALKRFHSSPSRLAIEYEVQCPPKQRTTLPCSMSPMLALEQKVLIYPVVTSIACEKATLPLLYPSLISCDRR